MKSNKKKILATILSIGFVFSMGYGYSMFDVSKDAVSVIAQTPANATIESGTLYDITELDFAGIDEAHLASGGTQTLNSDGGGMLINADGSNNMTLFKSPAGIKLNANFNTVGAMPATWPADRTKGFTFVMDGTNVCFYNDAVAILNRHDEVTCDIVRFDKVTGTQYVELNREFVKDENGTYIGVQCRITVGENKYTLYYETSNPNKNEFGIFAVDCGSLTISSAKNGMGGGEQPEISPVEKGKLYDISELDFGEIDEANLANGGSQTLNSNGGGMLMNGEGGWDTTIFKKPAGIKLKADFTTVGEIPASWPVDRTNGFAFVMDGTNVHIYNNAVAILNRHDESVNDVITFDKVTGVQYVEVNREFLRDSNGAYVGVQVRVIIGTKNYTLSYDTTTPNKDEFAIFAVDCGSLEIFSANLPGQNLENVEVKDITEYYLGKEGTPLNFTDGYVTIAANDKSEYCAYKSSSYTELNMDILVGGIEFLVDFGNGLADNKSIVWAINAAQFRIYNNRVSVCRAWNDEYWAEYTTQTIPTYTGVQYVKIVSSFKEVNQKAFRSVEVQIGNDTYTFLSDAVEIYPGSVESKLINDTGKDLKIATAKWYKQWNETLADFNIADYETADQNVVLNIKNSFESNILSATESSFAQTMVAFESVLTIEQKAALIIAKDSAKAELDTYVMETDYYATEWTEIQTIVADGKSAIEASANISAVEVKSVEIKTAIDAIYTKVKIDTICTNKEVSKAELLASYETFVESDYTDENWALIIAYYTQAVADIDAKEDLIDMEDIVDYAIFQMESVAKKNAKPPVVDDNSSGNNNVSSGDDNSTSGCFGSITMLGGAITLLAGAVVLFKKKFED